LLPRRSLDCETQGLRDYWKQVRSPKYLFPGKTFDVPLSSTTIQKTCKAAVQKAGILKNVTPHTLRHSYATGLLEAGVDLLTISRLLGHKSFSTTMIYLHVRRPHLQSTPSPIDWLPVRQRRGYSVRCDRLSVRIRTKQTTVSAVRFGRRPNARDSYVPWAYHLF
jgi:hypothetical protein